MIIRILGGILILIGMSILYSPVTMFGIYCWGKMNEIFHGDVTKLQSTYYLNGSGSEITPTVFYVIVIGITILGLALTIIGWNMVKNNTKNYG